MPEENKEQSIREKIYPIEKILAPVDNLLRNKPVSGVLLFLAVVIALIWVNSPYAESYHHLWETHFKIGFGDHIIDKDLHHWINDGLMAIFFFVVGLEIKREIVAGDLSSWKKASLPVAAAVGGMIFPAIIFTIFNFNTPTESGWGVPMATDIAFTLGVLSLLGNKVPLSLKIFLTALAIVDDLGAVLVIAFFYTDNLLFLYLEYGLGFFLFLGIGNALGIRNTAFYAIIGICGLWVAFLLSGVHATIAGVLLAMTIPSKAKLNKFGFIKRVDTLLAKLQKTKALSGAYISDEQQEIIEDIKEERSKVETPLQKLEYVIKELLAKRREDEKIQTATKKKEIRDSVPSTSFKKEISKQIVRAVLGHDIDADILRTIDKEIDNCPVVLSVEATNQAVENGYLTAETANKALNLPENEHLKAKIEHAERLARIQAAQSKVKGVNDLESDPKKSREKITDKTQDADLKDKTRGVEK